MSNPPLYYLWFYGSSRYGGGGYAIYTGQAIHIMVFPTGFNNNNLTETQVPEISSYLKFNKMCLYSAILLLYLLPQAKGWYCIATAIHCL